MAAINATLVKQLRDKSGAGVIDCKNALLEAAGDFDAALERLRALEAAKAASKLNRIAAEGLTAVAVEGNTGALIELNTETDFVARTRPFQEAAAAFARIALEVRGDRAALLDAPAPDGDGRVADTIVRLAARTGEHVDLRRSAFVSAGRGVVASYIHNVAAPGLGKIGVLVALESEDDPASQLAFGRKIAMHVAASAPLWVSPDEVPAEVIAEKRAALTEEASQTGKPPVIVAKMVEGRLRRFYEDTVLMLQPFVLNPSQRVEQALAEAEAAAGTKIVVGAFARLRTGEGIEKASAI